MREFLRGLPVRTEKWAYRRIGGLTWQQLLKSSAKYVFVILSTLGVVSLHGVIQGSSYDWYNKQLLPWLIRPFEIPNGWLSLLGFGCALGWLGFIVTGGSAILIYGADRRRLGELEVVGEENAERESEIADLNRQLGQLTNQLQNEQESRNSLLTLFSASDRELLTLLTENDVIDDNQIMNFFEGACRRIFNYLGNTEDLFRARIYLPDKVDKDFLTMRWDFGIGDVSRRWNRWYIGDADPRSVGAYRGITGEVFVTGNSRISLDVRAEPDFIDLYQPPRDVLPYKTFMQALIHPNDNSKKCGVFCIDSLTYNFTENDLVIFEQMAIRLGWLLKNNQDQML